MHMHSVYSTMKKQNGHSLSNSDCLGIANSTQTKKEDSEEPELPANKLFR